MFEQPFPRHAIVAPASLQLLHILSWAWITASSNPQSLLLLTWTPGAQSKQASCTQHSVPGGLITAGVVEVAGASSLVTSFVLVEMTEFGVSGICWGPPSLAAGRPSIRAGVAAGTNLHGGDDPPSSNWSKDSPHINKQTCYTWITYLTTIHSKTCTPEQLPQLDALQQDSCISSGSLH